VRRIQTSTFAARFLFLTILAIPAPLPAQEPVGSWVGKRVVQRVTPFSLKFEPEGAERKTRQLETFRVENVKGSWLRLQASDLEGWALAKDVIPVEGAIEHFTSYIQANPNDPFGFYIRAKIWYEERKEHEKAIADYTEVIRLVPKEAWIYGNRGSLWFIQRNYYKAIADFDQAIRLDPRNTWNYFNRGLAWQANQDHDKAIADYTEAIRLNPMFARSYLNRGLEWLAKNEYDRAIADCNEAVSIDPKNASAYQARARAWCHKKSYNEAIADYDKVTSINPKNAGAYMERSVLLLITGREGVEKNAREAISLGGWWNDRATYMTLVGYFGERRAKRDNTAFRLLIDGTNNSDPTCWPYPIIRFLRHQIDERALLREAVDEDKQCDARCFLGLDHLLAGRNEPAMEHFRWAKQHANRISIAYMISVAEFDRLEVKPKP
jgi:tetratricopeptide (TPR) repeat protein